VIIAMRVIAGKSRGRTLKAVAGINTRPTTDKVKEAIFSMIGPHFDQERVLDLFAGTGGLGIEALSRGARQAVFIDIESKSIDVIKQNLQSTGFAGQSEIYRTDAVRSLKALKKRGVAFDLVFLDPPYRLHIIPQLVTTLSAENLLTDGAIIVCEHDRTVVLPEIIDKVAFWKSAQYGDTHITVYQASIQETMEES
jgi:16S rRNA (guanine966-N2)-methyltransferase